MEGRWVWVEKGRDRPGAAGAPLDTGIYRIAGLEGSAGRVSIA